MADPHIAQGEPAQEQHQLWVDWSGLTAVWVCECGEQGFGGFDIAHGRWGAMSHRASRHPEWGAIEPYVTRLPCAWGDTPWGQAKRQACQEPAGGTGFCKKHYQSDLDYRRAGGMCDIEKCTYARFAPQDICRTHLTRWADSYGLDRTAVYGGAILWPDLPPVEAPQKGVPGKARTVAAPIELPYKKAHGTRAGYKAGCRCGPCGAAQAEYAAHARRVRLAKGASS